MNELLWKEYVIKKVIKTNELPDKIANSWEVCRKEQLNPYQMSSQTILQMDELSSKQVINRQLIDLVREEAHRISNYLMQSESLFILTDPEGYILWRQGNPRAITHANSIGFFEGSRWNELDVGTNAISLTLKTKNSQMVSRYEHYAVASHNWSCFACPIFDEDQLVGVLDMSTYMQEDVGQQALVQLIVERVSNRLLRYRLDQNQALLTYVVGNDNKSVLCNEKDQLVFLPEELTRYEELFVGMDIREFVKQFNGLVNKEKIHHDSHLIGYKYTFYPKKTPENKYYPGVPSLNKGYQTFLQQVFQAAGSVVPIHIKGESGSGKEIIAETIHYNSPYKDGPLISVNCGSLSENLLESELFGYAAGAFTGASKEGYLGKIRLAEGGTLFLDEVDSMSLKMQATLLRALEQKLVTPIGSTQSYHVDFRIVTASNQDLKQAVGSKQFREDLYYRLFVCPLQIPPLRQRTEDLLPLIDRFCEQNAWQLSWKDKLYQVSVNYPWYGNVREFNNFLQRLYVFYPDQEPTEQAIIDLFELASLQPDSEEPNKEPENSEAQLIMKTLKQHNYHKSKTATALNISRTTLYRKIKQYQLKID